MKKILIIIAILVSAIASASAQLPRWIIPPENDELTVKLHNRLLETRKNGQSTLWTLDGEKRYTTEHTIMPYNGNRATVMNKAENTIVGIVDTEGRFTALPENTQPAFDKPYYQNGFLVALTPQGYTYFNAAGEKVYFPFVAKGYPFNANYAPYIMYDKPERRQGQYYGYFRADANPVDFKVNIAGKVKNVDVKDIQFLSSIGPTGKSIGVIKNHLYWFDPATETFTPMMHGNEMPAKKQHLTTVGEVDTYFANIPDDEIRFPARYGKDGYAVLTFDPELVPLKIEYADDTVTFVRNEPDPVMYKTSVTSFGTDKYGLALDNKRILPPQFDAVGQRYANKAIVSKRGKWGLLEIVPGLDFNIRLNKDEDIPFRHQKFETQIRLDLPPSISSTHARLDIPASTGIAIDKTSRESKNTESGNFVTYDCVLTIPETLSDTMTRIVYSPITVTYDDLTLYEVSDTVNAWHLKYYNIDPIENETTIQNGVVTFTININAQRMVGEGDYPFEVRIQADTPITQIEKISETRYKCQVADLHDGANNINILVIEKGCPPSVFPFEVNYSKPSAKTKKKEEVTVRKRKQTT